MDNISFNGKFINRATIKELNKTNTHKNKFSFIELDPKDLQDRLTLFNLSNIWKDSYASKITDSLYLYPQHIDNKIVYGITTQTKNFKRVDESKILGIAEVARDNNNYDFIEYLQVNPNYTNKHENILFKFIEKIFNKKPQPFSGIGTELLNNLKNISKKDLELSAISDAIPFYKKNDFKIIDKYNNIMQWKNNKFKK